ncbi:MAG: S41 family peptidase [Flavobacteriales bacterium]
MFYVVEYIDMVTSNKNEVIWVSYSNKEEKIKRLFSLIDERYIRTIETDNIIDITIQYILSNLDHHNSHISKKDTTKTENQLKGRFVGIGIEYQLIDDTIVITRKDNEKPFSILIKKQTFSLQSIESVYMLDEDLGYIKLNHFGDHAFEEFQQEVKKLRSLGMNEPIFDLRDYTEDRVDIAINIVYGLLEEDQLIIFTKQRNGPNQYYYATSQGSFKEDSLYVLLNERSTSADEIIDGTLQDNDRGTIVRRPFFGNRLIQQDINLGDRSLVRLTVTQYFITVGPSIQKNYDVKYNKYEAIPETYSSKNVGFSNALKFTTSKGKVILEGGGVTLDILIPTESIQTKSWLDDPMSYDFLNNLAFNYIDAHRSKLNQYTAQKFIDHFDTKSIINKILFHLKKDKNFNQTDQETLAIFLKGFMARQLFDLEIFYQILNQRDTMIIKILNLKKLNKTPL